MASKENPLDKKHVDNWLKGMSRGMYVLTQKMEENESWITHPDASAESLKDIVDQLENNPSFLLIKEDDKTHLDNILYLLAHLPSSQAFRMLNLAVRKQEDITSKLTRAAQLQCVERGSFHPESRVMIDRLMVVLRARCFSLVFGPKRRKDILSILGA